MAKTKKRAIPEWPRLRPQGTDTAYWCDDCLWVHEASLVLEEGQVFHLDPSMGVCEKRLQVFRALNLGRDVNPTDAERSIRRYHNEI